MKFIPKPTEIEAIQWTGQNQAEILAFCRGRANGPGQPLIFFAGGEFSLDVKDGTPRRGRPGDYLIMGVVGQVLHRSREMFERDYEPAHSSSSLPLPTANGQLTTLPSLSRFTRDGVEIILVPVFIEIPVDPLEGFTAEEAPRVALDRLAELPLEVTLGGVPLAVQSAFPLFEEELIVES